MTRLTAEDVRGVVAILATPALPGAERWDMTETVDLEESARHANALVEAGVDMILTNGTFGEGATLTLDELMAFNDAVVATVAGRVPVFAGATTLNTRDTIDRGRRLREIGADGLFLGRPMWVALDDDQIVEFHRSVAEALPDMAQIAYDNPSAFKGKISSQAYARLAEIPQIVASKHMGLGLLGERYTADLEAVAGRINLLPVADDWATSARMYPEQATACWSGDVNCGPAPVTALRDAIRARDWALAEQIQADIAHAVETLFPGGDFNEFQRYNIQIDRAEFEASGYFTPGPTRPPYTTAPAAYLEGGAEVGRRWAALQKKYAGQSARAESTRVRI